MSGRSLVSYARSLGCRINVLTNQKLPKVVIMRCVRFILRRSPIAVRQVISLSELGTLFLVKDKNYMVYPMLEEQDRVTCYRNSSVASEDAQGIVRIRISKNFRRS